MNKNALLLILSFSLITLTSSFAEVLEGVIQPVIVEDFTQSQTQYLLLRTGQTPLKLTKLDEASVKLLSQLSSKAKVKLSGKTSIKGFDVTNTTLLKLPSTQRTLKTSSSVETTLVAGLRTVAIFPITFPGGVSTPGCDPEIVKGFLSPNGAVYSQYNDNLKGKVTFEPTVFDPVEVVGSQTCEDYNLWLTHVFKAAHVRGIPINDYEVIMLLVPRGATCAASYGWVGDGTLLKGMYVSMHPSHCANPGAIAHELGHTIGWRHASTPSAEYGDQTDVMGGTLLIHSSLPRKLSTGMVTENQIQDIKAPGLYRLGSLVPDSSEIKALRWPLRNQVTLRSQSYTDLYISYRTWEGRDAVPAISERMNKTHVHLWNNFMWGYTSNLGELGDNDLVDINSNPVSVRQVSHNAQGSLVCVKIDGVGDCSTEIKPPRNIDSFSYVITPKLKLTATLTEESIPYVGSVSFKFSSGATVTDNSAPYSACGDGGTDPCEALASGPQKVTITAYAGPNGNGSAGPSVVKDFTKVGGPLPVTITSFTGSSVRSSIVLDWKTTEESNFDHFEVESSTDAKTWKFIMKVTGSRTGSYSATVPATAAMLYFRLKMVDKDASFAYSRIISVKSSVVNPAITPIRKNAVPVRTFQAPGRSSGTR